MGLKEKLLTKEVVGAVVGGIVLALSTFVFIDDRYFHSASAAEMEIKLAGALDKSIMEQKKFYADQQKINDMRQLDQLRCSRALLEAELKRNPGNSHIIEKINIIDSQIKLLEEKVYK